MGFVFGGFLGVEWFIVRRPEAPVHAGQLVVCVGLSSSTRKSGDGHRVLNDRLCIRVSGLHRIREVHSGGVDASASFCIPVTALLGFPDFISKLYECNSCDLSSRFVNYVSRLSPHLPYSPRTPQIGGQVSIPHPSHDHRNRSLLTGRRVAIITRSLAFSIIFPSQGSSFCPPTSGLFA